MPPDFLPNEWYGYRGQANTTMTRKKSYRMIGIAVLCGTLLTSCFHDRLPDDWTVPQPPGTTCDISGVYHNRGERTDTDRPPLTLVESLAGPETFRPATHVSIRQNQDSIYLTAQDLNEVLGSWTLSMKSGDYKCRDGWIEISSSDWGAAGGTMVAAVGGSRDTKSFARTPGYLLMKSSGIAAVMAIVPVPFPIVASMLEWFRFPAYTYRFEESTASEPGEQR